ncbi:MAG: M28 family peptidase [Bryobacteraceae bacterium]|nr:M28 family peptidase [Bryobacteraceae bacterium]
MRKCAVIAVAAVLTACSTSGEADPQAASKTITSGALLEHIKVLASDQFEGRLPGSAGEDLTVDYLTKQFQSYGLAPGNPDGTYVQNVPLAAIRSDSTASIQARGRKLRMQRLDDYVAVSRRLAPVTEVKDSEMIFVGYGVVAPEYGWDDYKDVDVKGKTLVMLINDPAIPDASDPSQLDPNMFKGRAMTYYGRWTYKYEIAQEKGAAAAVIIHETGPAGYPWSVVRSSWGGENFEIRASGGDAEAAPVESWITLDKARELLAASGQTLDELKKAAIRKDFRPVALPARASFTVKNTVREVNSRNVIAKLEGGDRKDEYVVYSAHWDHLGRDSSLEGDQIFNGAIDNASGTAAMLEIARAFSRLQPRPRRSILFLAVTAEEQGLLGAKYYAEHPLYPLNKTVANINIDGMNQWGRTKDIVVIGLGNSTLDDLAAEVAREQGRELKPDAEPEKGFYYRADHFEFAQKGVPAFYTDSGTDYIGKPAGFAEEKRREFTENDYHKASDEVKPDWDLSGGAEDTQFLFLLGYRVAQADAWPEWKPGTEFKARREAMLR